MPAVRKLWAIAISAVAAALIVGLTIVPAASASEGCENEARRVEQNSTFLPDCRAYELVSPPSMPPPGYWRYSEGGIPPIRPDGFAEPVELHAVEYYLSAAVGGDAVLYQGSEANSQGAGERNNLSRRGPDGWTGENIEPPQSRRGFLCGVTGYVGFSENFEEVAWIDVLTEDEDGKPDSIEDCGHDEPPLASGEPKESGNLFLRNTVTGSYQLVNVTPAGTESYEPWFDAISADGSHVVFNSRAHLTSDAPPDPGDVGCRSSIPNLAPNEFGDVYVWSAGTVHLLTVLPDGTELRGTLAGALGGGCSGFPLQSAQMTHAISKDGERILFYAGGGFELESGKTNPQPDAPYIDGGLYLREHPGAEQSALSGSGDCTEPQKACTIQVDLPETGASGSPGDGQFRWANAETTKIFFTDTEKLTSDSTAAPGKPDLYEYDLEKPEGERLTDLTASASEPANVLGVSGASEDGSYLYFVAQGDLTGAQQNSHGATALAPAQGSGTLSGAAKLTGDITEGTDQVTEVSVTSGEFHVGQEIVSTNAIDPQTVISACTPNCAEPTGLTLSKSTHRTEDVELTGIGSTQIAGVSASSGSFRPGMAVSGAGILPATWITQVGAGTLTLSRGVTADGTQALSATAGNLYLSHAGATTFIAALPSEVDRCNWNANCLTARVSPNGAYLAFDSFAALTGYDNTPVRPNACAQLTLAADEPCPETFRYAATGGAHGELTCASCNPSGAPPASEFAWSIIPQTADESGPSYISQLSNSVINSGEVFFETMETLLPTDKNETWDVYEYGGGEGASAQLHMISSGQGDQPSFFMNATPDGSNVFFVTGQPLLRADTRTNYDIYDARVDGGFRSQSEAIQPPLCQSEEGCLPPLSEPPAELPAASGSLSGSGNLAGTPPPPPGKVPVTKPTRMQLLERALKTCSKKYRHSAKKRHGCERKAREHYGAKRKGTGHTTHHGNKGRGK